MIFLSNLVAHDVLPMNIIVRQWPLRATRNCEYILPLRRRHAPTNTASGAAAALGDSRNPAKDWPARTH